MKSVPCNLCESKANTPLFHTKDIRFGSDDEFALVKCSHCSLVFINPLPSKKEMDGFYPPSYYGTKETLAEPELLRETSYEQDKMSKIQKSGILPETGRILDVGCGKGEFLTNMREKGWETYGIETAKIAADYAKEKMGIKVFRDKLPKANFLNRYFDAVTFWHALEHLSDPSAALMEANRILKPEGRLLISVPNFQSWQARVMKSDWYHLDIPRHLYHFTPQTITQLLRKTGFQILIIDFISPPHDRDGIKYSTLRKIERWQKKRVSSIQDSNSQIQLNIDSEHASSVETNDSSYLLKSVGLRCFESLATVSNYLERLLHCGGTMFICASKEHSAKDIH